MVILFCSTLVCCMWEKTDSLSIWSEASRPRGITSGVDVDTAMLSFEPDAIMDWDLGDVGLGVSICERDVNNSDGDQTVMD